MFNGSRWLTEGEVPQTYSYWGTYPHMFLMADGRLFYSGGHTFGNNLPGTGSSLYDWRTRSIQDVPGLRDKDLTDQAASFWLGPVQDQRIAITGGGNTDQNLHGTTRTDVIDLKQAAPTYRPLAPLPGPGRAYVNAVTLPNRQTLVTGGATHNRSGEVLASSLLDPVTEAWSTIPADPVHRGYHSTAVLLPDGRVVVAGGNPADNSFELRISVYSPSYVTKNRPSLTSAPTAAAPGTTHTVSASGGSGTISRVSLLAPMSVTHQTDTNMRLINVPFSGKGNSVRATIPRNANLVPPGPYMIVVQDSAGVPSIARWVNVR
jgi:hypothetical protein